MHQFFSWEQLLKSRLNYDEMGFQLSITVHAFYFVFLKRSIRRGQRLSSYAWTTFVDADI